MKTIHSRLKKLNYFIVYCKQQIKDVSFSKDLHKSYK